MNQFFEAFANMFRIPDLRKRLLFTLAMLAVYRLGAFLPTPGINTDVLAQFFNQNQGSVLGVIDLDTRRLNEIRSIAQNEIGVCTLSSAHPITFDRYADCKEMGSFILIDPESCDTVGMGCVEGIPRA